MHRSPGCKSARSPAAPAGPGSKEKCVAAPARMRLPPPMPNPPPPASPSVSPDLASARPIATRTHYTILDAPREFDATRALRFAMDASLYIPAALLALACAAFIFWPQRRSAPNVEKTRLDY